MSNLIKNIEKRVEKMNLSDRKGDKFGIFQSSDVSCVFYKEDKDGKQSTFNLFILSEKDEKKIFAYIDNNQFGKKVWHSDNKITIHEAIKVFNEWAVDAPVLFELEAHKSLTNCLQSFMINE